MAHKLIVGQTLSGKSTLARAMAADAAKRGIAVAVYDPTLSGGWNTEYVTSDEREFLAILSHIHEDHPGAFVIIDEADTMLGMSHRHNWWLFQRGRHYGFELCAITQRPQNVAPAIRGNAPELFVFQLGNNDARFLEDDNGTVGLTQAPELRQGEFLRAYWKNGKKVVDRLKIF